MNSKRIGVWLDHHKACFISHEPLNEHVQTILSEVENQQRFDGETANGTNWDWAASSNEYRKNHRKMELLNRYYSTIAKLLEEYDEILLFGPTDAKKELQHVLQTCKPFKEKNIFIQNSDKLSENQMLATVREHFNGNGVKVKK
jgi:hypothetical protein